MGQVYKINECGEILRNSNSGNKRVLIKIIILLSCIIIVGVNIIIIGTIIGINKINQLNNRYNYISQILDAALSTNKTYSQDELYVAYYNGFWIKNITFDAQQNGGNTIIAGRSNSFNQPSIIRAYLDCCFNKKFYYDLECRVIGRNINGESIYFAREIVTVNSSQDFYCVYLPAKEGKYPPCNYMLEIWIDNKCIKTEQFNVY